MYDVGEDVDNFASIVKLLAAEIKELHEQMLKQASRIYELEQKVEGGSGA